MKSTEDSTPFYGTSLARDRYLAVLKAALSVSENRFAREAALEWLAAFPGDLLASLLYARALLAEGRARQALPILTGLCTADPEFTEAQEALILARREGGLPASPDSLSCVVALGGKLADGETVASWGRQLWLARLALKRGEVNQAEGLVRLTLAADADTPLVAVTHLEVLEAQSAAPLAAKRNLAEFYRQRWPDCLPFTLFLADWLMDGGEADAAVSLLHQAAARDVSGQVSVRLWGERHPYQAVWPDRLELALEIPVPASVSALMGWNRLASGAAAEVAAVSEQTLPAGGPPQIARMDPQPLITPQSTSQAEPGAEPANEPDPGLESGSKSAAQFAEETAAQGPHQPARPSPDLSQVPETLRPIQEELERVADRLNKPGLVRTDGRFPVYVIFSVRRALEAKYGPQKMACIEAEMSRLAQTVQDRHDWGARIFLADDPSCTGPLDIRPARPDDPWELKLALADLDAALAKRGEMIGAVLIVGGPEIVPFHLLPNPVDDPDLDIPSDNPYTTRDENYFIPEWPVGRLPDGAGTDESLLLKALRQTSDQHASRQRPEGGLRRFIKKMLHWLRPIFPVGRPSFGYTAAVWRNASLSVFRPIGEPRSLMISPPLAVNETANGCDPRLPSARLGYFNLHGLSDSPEWYGQRDPVDGSTEGPDYPVALRPQDVGIGERTNNCGAPHVIFTEACYGMHIQGKAIDEALALKFLASGSQAIAGSTSMAYGSISTPLIAADLLGHAFWDFVRAGLPAGEALRRSKIHLAREMHNRQGYLDGEDQKTLISFVLYGDPLAQPLGSQTGAKSILRPLKPPAAVKTVCDRVTELDGGRPVPSEVMGYVKHVVSQYLPGMDGATITFTEERSQCAAHGHVCPTSQLRHKRLPNGHPARSLVTLSKEFQRSQHTHTQVARLTLDPQGKLVKLVISR